MKTTEKDDIVGALARGYCHPSNEKKVFDPDLMEAINQEIVPLFKKKHKELLFWKKKALMYMYYFCPEDVKEAVAESKKHKG